MVLNEKQFHQLFCNEERVVSFQKQLAVYEGKIIHNRDIAKKDYNMWDNLLRNKKILLKGEKLQ